MSTWKSITHSGAGQNELADVKVFFRMTIPQNEGESIALTVVVDKHAKISVILSGQAVPLEFDTPFGKKSLFDTWAVFYGQNYFLIDDGPTESLGIYDFEGKPVSLPFNSSMNTIEVFYRIRREALTRVDGNPFLLRPSLPSLAHLPAFGPE